MDTYSHFYELAKTSDHFQIYYIDYVVIIIGVIIVIANNLFHRTEKSLSCLIGWHRFEYVRYDDPFSLFIDVNDVVTQRESGEAYNFIIKYYIC
ncbi:hypothetical protein [Oceanobacillus sp. E9]|uniref:hypothetical protein n=1 Tax=Oceanobacillus sp. E9 TaxID=1742575 RepID=UPI001112F578|nr:hypothetical protein [Oceanobacillus sp. E9]